MRNRQHKSREDGGFALYPYLLFEIFCLVVLVVEAVLLLSLAFPPPVGRQVDFAFRFSPKPAWYFLPLYEMVKFFPGKLVFLGASVIPLLGLAALYAVPWLDRSPETGILRRPVALLTFLLVAAGTLYLLWRGWSV